jgi:hypothetical protein
MNHKTVDINQRIPLAVLETALVIFLNGNYSNDYVKEQLSLEFTGENRIKKSLRIVNRIIINSPIKDFLISHKEELLTALKSKTDRNILLISLLNASFSFSFDVFSLFGKYLGVQEQISGEAMLKSVRSIYGGNRAPEIGFYAVVPMYVEADLISRIKPGIYICAKSVKPAMKITTHLLRESFKHQKGINQWSDYHESDPYFKLIEV